ncbi:hypothetical protein, conserved [Eimeria necatrix]|uniref:Ku domain-containing protein n=1 Tax=Eimeria necatrix TaxID=51315 RepID=U6N2Z4_9EIME|nr:hypothetical protein, conserved [Eimeria necatrix]CDJ68320.1 hypothetical protein, conserved [Eimeria necatrix]
MASVQSVSCVLADVGSAACASGCFPSVSLASLSLLSNRFASDPKHVAAVIAYGSATTHNPLADASQSGQAYNHVEILHNFHPIDWPLVEELGKVLKPGGQPADPLDACIVAADLFQKAFNKQIQENKIECIFYLLSGPQPFEYDSDAQSVRQHMTETHIRVVRVLAGEPPAGESTGDFFDREVSMKDFIDLCRLYVPVKSKKTVTKCRIPLTLSPSVKLSVFVYILAKKEPLPSLRKRLKVCRNTAGSEREGPAYYVAMTPERFLYRADDPEKRPIHMPSKKGAAAAAAADPGASTYEEMPAETEGLAFAFPFGKQLVPVSPFEREAHFSLKTDKGLVLVGMLRTANIKRWWLTGQSELVVASEGDSISQTAMSALFWACVRLRCALLCRYTPRQNSLPRPVLLVPRFSYADEDWEELLLQAQNQKTMTVQRGFCLVHIPFSDDVSSPALPVPPAATPDEVQAMEALIDSLPLSFSPVSSFSTSAKRAAPHHCTDRRLCEKIHPLCAPPSVYPSPDIAPFSSEVHPSFVPKSARAFAEPNASVNPLLIPNPTMQRFLRLISSKILDIATHNQQQQQQQEQRPESGKGYQDLLRAVDDLFPLTPSVTEPLVKTPGEEKASPAPTATKHPGVCGAIAALFPLVAQGPLREFAAATTAARGEAAEALSKEFVRKNEVLKLTDVKLQHQLEQKERAEDGQKVKQDPQQDKGPQHPLLQQYAVRSINPVRDFELMLNVREIDLTEKAISEMQQIILELLQRAEEQWAAAGLSGQPDGIGTHQQGQKQPYEQEQQVNGIASRYLVKAMMCLEALRAGCVRELEGKAFNAFLRQLHQQATAAETEKAAQATPAAQTPQTGAKLFWDLLLSKKQIPLVTTDEDPHADVAPEDSTCIYNLPFQEQQQQHQQQQYSGNEAADILDLIE